MQREAQPLRSQSSSRRRRRFINAQLHNLIFFFFSSHPIASQVRVYHPNSRCTNELADLKTIARDFAWCLVAQEGHDIKGGHEKDTKQQDKDQVVAVVYYYCTKQQRWREVGRKGESERDSSINRLNRPTDGQPIDYGRKRPHRFCIALASTSSAAEPRGTGTGTAIILQKGGEGGKKEEILLPMVLSARLPASPPFPVYIFTRFPFPSSFVRPF